DPKWQGRAGAHNAGFLCNLCVGETLQQREAGQTDAVNEGQLRAGLKGVSAQQMSRVVIAYEPVWAIGTGKTATPDDARLAHGGIRSVLAAMYGKEVSLHTRIQYGGSVKASNARELFSQPGINGGLIGGASLKAEEFCGIVRAAS
ncbi:MAG: triosephosphate isomerase, partial [Pyrinomonadaceae bacterium]|nr:triosephosphate isomerase [Phycisphaerales bacterium]